MKVLVVKSGDELKYGSIKDSGDRKVIKNGFEIFLKAEKL
jgi:hypothetical protein